MENQVYNWLVKKGNIIIQKNGDCISLKADYENGEYCLLTKTDTNEIIKILSAISKQIWENPNYKRKPYVHQLYKTDNNGYYWQIENSKIVLKYSEIENGIELRYVGRRKINLELNYIVEIIQILEKLCK